MKLRRMRWRLGPHITEMPIKVWSGNMKGRDYLGDLSTHRMIIVK
jgi:hypothetical protein